MSQQGIQKMFEEAFRAFSMIQAAVYTMKMEPFYGMVEDMNNNLRRMESVMAEIYRMKTTPLINAGPAPQLEKSNERD